jgi:hypothetical protein
MAGANQIRTEETRGRGGKGMLTQVFTLFVVGLKR